MGGQSPHDPKETSSNGGSDFARVVSPHVAGFHIVAAGAAREELVRIGFVALSWTRLAEGLRLVVWDLEDQQIGMPGHGWQQAATLSATEQALLRCEGGPLSGVPSLILVFQSARWHVVGVSRWSQPLPEFAARQEPGGH